MAHLENNALTWAKANFGVNGSHITEHLGVVEDTHHIFWY